ncbi:unnamed protein product [Brachionus calyciflorus]|uniref:Uncharacterized protein n=1 Tax=Brachionus calyciflorus TaxID=104777 RepID=A0A813MWQ0_9BILA|nr:unnamed protein product [Brachionus calyciflorus]
MKLLKTHIIEYFDCLKNEIDVNCEELFTSFNLFESHRVRIESIRTNFLDNVDRIFNLNLKKFGTRKKLENEEINLDDWEFCFFLPKASKFGVLVLTNQFIPENTRLSLRGDFLNDEFNSDIMTKREILLENLIQKILDVKFESEIKDDIIDLRDGSHNIIESFTLESFKFSSLEPTDLSVMENLVNKECLNHWELSLDVTILEKNLFSNFKNIHFLEISLNESCILQDDCFNGLDNLKRLTVLCSAKVFEENVFYNLKNLEELSLKNSKIDALGENSFKNLPKIENLDLFNASIKTIASGSLKDLTTLKYLNLTENHISSLPIGTFDCLKNLSVLFLIDALRVEISAECFNNLENLEILAIIQRKKPGKICNLDELKLSKLKCLAIDSNRVPDFDLNLEMLVIYGLEEFNENMFDRLSDLKGLVINLDQEFLQNIKKELFKNMEKLAYLSIKFNDLSKESLEFIKKNENIYKEFLNQPIGNFVFRFVGDFHHLRWNRSQ